MCLLEKIYELSYIFMNIPCSSMFFFEDKKNKFDCGSICVVPRIIKLILLENETKCESALTQIQIHNEIHHMYEIFTES